MCKTIKCHCLSRHIWNKVKKATTTTTTTTAKRKRVNRSKSIGRMAALYMTYIRLGVMPNSCMIQIATAPPFIRYQIIFHKGGTNNRNVLCPDSFWFHVWKMISKPIHMKNLRVSYTLCAVKRVKQTCGEVRNWEDCVSLCDSLNWEERKWKRYKNVKENKMGKKVIKTIVQMST